MKLEQKVAKVTDVNPRKENHGDDRKVLACDVTFVANCDASVLAEFDTKLKSFLFGEHGPQFPELGAVEWGREYENVLVKVNGKVELKAATIKKISLKPEQGESVKFKFTATIYPTKATLADLASLLQEEVFVELEPGQQDLVDQQRTGTEG